MLPLEGVGVYVDVRSSDGKANYSKCVSEQLQMLGADIKTTLTNQCSHVVGMGWVSRILLKYLY